MARISLFLAVILVCVGASAQTSTVNKSLNVPPGTNAQSDYSSVNGSLRVGEGSEIQGDCTTVNGSLRVEENCTVDKLSTVNGSLKMASGVRVLKGASTVNGSIKAGEGCTISGKISTVNGSITLNDGLAGDDIQTVNGDIRLTGESEVIGDIVVRKAKKRGRWGDKEIDIFIEDQSIVRGDIRVEDPVVEVTVHISPEAEVVGVVSNARVVRN